MAGTPCGYQALTFVIFIRKVQGGIKIVTNDVTNNQSEFNRKNNSSEGKPLKLCWSTSVFRMIPQLQAFSIKNVLSLKMCCFGAQNACFWKGTTVAWRDIHHSKFIQFWEKIVNEALPLILFHNIKVREKIQNKYKVS